MKFMYIGLLIVDNYEKVYTHLASPPPPPPIFHRKICHIYNSRLFVVDNIEKMK